MTSSVLDGSSSDSASIGPIGREIVTVASFEAKGLLLGVRALLILVMYGGFVFSVGAAYLAASAKIEQQMVEKVPALEGKGTRAIFDEWTKSKEFEESAAPELEKLGGRRLIEAIKGEGMPLSVLFTLFITGFGIPGLLLIAGYDRLSEDLHTRYARFVLQRVRRESLVVGRVLGQWAAVMALMMATHLALVGLGAAFSDRLEVREVLTALPRAWLALAALTLAYLSFVAVFSALLTPPFAALAVGGMGLMGVWFLKLAIPTEGLKWTTGIDVRLWLAEPVVLLGYAVVAALLMTGAVLIIRARDV